MHTLLLSHERAAGEPAVSYENKGSVAPLLPDIAPLYYINLDGAHYH